MKRLFAVLLLIAGNFLAAYFLCTKIIPEDFYPAVVSFFQGPETLEIISLDPETKLQITWVYEAKVNQSQRQNIAEYQRTGDVSFKRIAVSEGWTVSDEGYLQTDQVNAQASFTYPKFSNSVFVFCLRTVGGDAIVRLNFPGGHVFTRIEGKNNDAAPISSAAAGSHAWKLSALLVFILTGILLSSLSVFLFFRWIAVYPLVEPEPVEKKHIHTNPFLYAAAFLIPFLLALAVCRLNGFAPFGTKAFLYNDMSNQNYRFFLYLKNMPQEHNDFFYSLSKTMGGSMLNFSPYYLYDLLVYIIFLFSEEQIPAYCTFLILLHLGCGGLTSFIYLRENGRTLVSSLLFSCAYALMAFNIVCADNPYFLTGMIVLPIVLLGLEREIRQRRPLLYILSLAFALFSNFYFGWMVCIFTFVWFLYIEISEKRNTFFNDFLMFILHSLLAAGLIMAVLLPLAVSLTGSQKDFSLARMSPELLTSITGFLSKFFTSSFNHAQITTVKQGNPSLFCGTLTTIFFMLWFFQKDKNRRTVFCVLGVLGVFLLSFFVSSFYLVWHAFNYPLCWPFRFSFSFGFFMIYLASEAFDNRKRISLCGIISTLFIFSAVCFIVFKSNVGYFSDKMILLDWIIALIVIMCVLPKAAANPTIQKYFPAAAALLLLPDICLNMAHIWNTSYEETLNDSGISVDTYLREYHDVSLPVKQIRNADENFYRIEFAVRKGDNQGFRYSTNTVSHYSSTNDLRSMQFLDHMGYSAEYTGKSNYRYGSTMTADSLLGIKYVISEPDLAVKPYPVIDRNDTAIFQVNENALSLGMIASPDILAVLFEKNKPFSNQESLLSAVYGNPAALFTPVADLTFETENLTAEKQSQYTVFKKKDLSSSAELIWNFVSDREDMLYAWFPVLSQRSGFISLNGREIGKTIDPNNYGMIPLGVFPPGTAVSVSLKFDAESISLFDAVFMYEDIGKLDEISAGLVPVSDIVKHSSSHLTGTITSEKEGQWLFLTVPFSEEWIFHVNGALVEAERAAEALTAVPLDAGENQIEMQFVPEGFYSGLFISVVSCIGLLFVIYKKIY